jgi:hypothetical protein
VKFAANCDHNIYPLNFTPQLYGEAIAEAEATVFVEKTHGAYLVYLRYQTLKLFHH